MVQRVKVAGLASGTEVVVKHMRGLAELRRGQVVDGAAEVRVVEDVEEIVSELKGVSFCEAELATQGDVPLRGAEAAEGTASEIALRGGRYRHGERCGVDDLAASFSVSATSVVVNPN